MTSPLTLDWQQATKEPIIREASTDPPCNALIANISTRGIWQPQSTAIFDIHVIDSDAPSYHFKTPEVVFISAKIEKKTKYNEACESRHASFIPLCITIDGLVSDEMKHFLYHLANRLTTK